MIGLERSVPAMEALHEAGHVVMARLLGRNLGRVQINRSEGCGQASVVPPAEQSPEDKLRILLAARICVNSFGISTLNDQGGFGDEGEIRTILEDMFPDDERRQESYRNCLDAEVEGLFERPDVHTAAWAPANILSRAGVIDGLQAEDVIDQYLCATIGNKDTGTGKGCTTTRGK